MRVGHGQMRERDLEQLMVDFYHRRFNMLVCTTIIESGIDVPTANTIMIDRADQLGLAQLHQLRGRVGRSHHRAYAYLLTPPRKALSLDAVKRLEAIESLEDLGAGFVLATHDLEIRGAGELLGESQSGELTEIGLTMYLDMLEQAVKALKEGREPELDRPLAATAEVELRLPALLPESYVADVPVRLALYKRLAAAPDNAGDRRAHRGDRRPLRAPAAARHEPAARGKTQTDRTRHRNPPTRSGPAGWLRVVRGTEPGGPAGGHTPGAAPRSRLPARRRAQAAYFGGDRRRRRALRVRREVPERASRARRRSKPWLESRVPKRLISDPLYFAPMTTTGRFRRLRRRLDARAGERQRLARRPPRRRPRPTPRVYNVEVIVFRNSSGSGGPEDWSAKPVARGPDTPDAPVTGKFVQAIPASQFQLNDVAAQAAEHV